MKAKKKPLDFIQLGDLGIEHKQQVKLNRLVHPVSRKSGQRVSSVTELMTKLKNEAKVI